MNETGTNRKVLVTGANGFLGQHLCLDLCGSGFHVIAVSRGESRLPTHPDITYQSCDLTNDREVEMLFKSHWPDVVVHAAALSKPDECDINKEAAIKINVDATRSMLRYTQGHFIYISTDFVFGENGPHDELDETGPLNFYGESKLLAENEVINSGLHYAIVRPVFIYGKVWDGLRPSFLHWVKHSLEQGKSIKVVSDQLRTPTYVIDICAGIKAIIDKKSSGIFHLAGRDILSPFEIAIITAKTLGLNASLIENVTSDTFPEPVQRAKKSGLKINKSIEELGYKPLSFQEGVRLTFDL